PPDRAPPLRGQARDLLCGVPVQPARPAVHPRRPGPLRVGRARHGAGPVRRLRAARLALRRPALPGRDSKGRLYTTEGAHGRVQPFAPDGKPLAAWGDKGDQPGGCGAYRFATVKSTLGPVRVAVDRRDRVWVSSLNGRVQGFTPRGRYL